MGDQFSGYDSWKLDYPSEWDQEYFECEGCGRETHEDDLDEDNRCEECRQEEEE